jgi:NAD(P)-dependent dehydrogenase (short-subunit alcohol dehydrogenase family)
VQSLALELGPTHVRVNAVAPGWIGGPNVETFITWESESRAVDPDVVRKEITDRIPLRLIPPQDEIAHSVVFFASPWSKVITGQTLDVNGGEYFA